MNPGRIGRDVVDLGGKGPCECRRVERGFGSFREVNERSRTESQVIVDDKVCSGSRGGQFQSNQT